MSGQYPGSGGGVGGGYNSPLGGQRGHFNPQQQQQMVNPINQMSGGGGAGMGPNSLGGVGIGPQGIGGVGGGMMPMGGSYPQSSSMGMGQPNQSAASGMSNMGSMGMGGGGPGGIGVTGGMNPSGVGMQSPSHVQQHMLQQQQQQMQMQQHQQQQQMGGGQNPMSMTGVPGTGMMTGAGTGLMQQQQHPMGANTTVPQVSGASMQQQQQQLPISGGSTQVTPPSATGAGANAGPSTSANAGMLAISQPNPHKEINIVALSRLGQETVQDITSRFQEIFAALKIIQPTANRDNNTEKKVQEYFRTIRLLFKRVRIIYEKCNDGYPQGMEYTHVESLVPYKNEPDHRQEPTQCEEYRKALQENQELIETVKLKNRQLREIIDRTRIIIWEINTMLSMRRS